MSNNTPKPNEIRLLVERIKMEREIVQTFITDYNAMKAFNKRDSRLSGLSYAINCHKKLIDQLQLEIDNYNATHGRKRKEKSV